jgi:8-oxo-dGTP pyrophosphatase MutT (NUDIX family)
MSEPDTKPAGPRLAATVVLVREAPAGFEVLMVRRNRGASFMANAHVFPGGRLDESDGGDFVLAAAREAFEEAGVLLAVGSDGEPWRQGVAIVDGQAGWDDADLEAARADVREGRRRFTDLLGALRLAVDPARFICFARWVTPPTESRRFDAHFFLARMPEGQTARPDPSGEVVDFRWATPRALLDAQRAGEIQLPPPTLWHLTALSACASVDEAVAWARRQVVVPVRPKLCALDGIITIVLPWDPAYATAPVPVDEGEPIDPTHPVAGPVTRYELVDGFWVPRQAK